MRTTVRDASKEQRVRAAVASAHIATDRLSFVIANLNGDDGWDAAVAGCQYVLHVASPLGGGAAVWPDPDDPQFDAYSRVENSRGARGVGLHGA